MTSKTYTYPHYNIEVKDNSARVVPTEDIDGLHLPVFFGFAAKGPVGIPTYGDYAELSEIFGAETFNTRSKFYTHQALFAQFAARRQKILFVRLASADAARSSSVMYCTVTENVDVIQYERDNEGNFIVDAEGNRVPRTQEDGTTPIVEKGLRFHLTEEAIIGESISVTELTKETGTDSEGLSYTKYPLYSAKGAVPGAALNAQGCKLYFDHTAYSASEIDMVGALPYTFAPVKLDTNDNVVPIRNKFSEQSVLFSAKPDAFNKKTAQYLELSEVIDTNYSDPLEYDFHVFSEYFEEIGNKVIAVETNNVYLDSPWKVDVLTGKDFEGKAYDHVVFATEDAAIMNRNVVHYLSGGSDGLLTNEAFESLYGSYASGEVYPKIKDKALYPITHIYDSGFSLEGKYSVAEYFKIRDDVKLVMATQTYADAPNLASEDQSIGAALKARLSLFPESTLYSTEVCRASIYQQCGKLISNLGIADKSKSVPLTLDNLIKRCKYHSTETVTGEAVTVPAAAVTIFEDINWTPSEDEHKQTNWDTGLNYCQHYGRGGSRLFYPDMQSVYSNFTSVLSSCIFVDYLVYTKHMLRKSWPKFTGSMVPFDQLAGEIKKDIEEQAYKAFGVRIEITARPFQTEIDKAKGYVSSIELDIKGYVSNRVWNVTMLVDRVEG